MKLFGVFFAISTSAFGVSFANGEVHRSLQNTTCLAQSDVEARIQSFADGVPAVSAAYWDNGGTIASQGPHDENGGETVEACTAAYDLALSYIEGAYGYPDQVLFDPTLTTEPYRFRPTLAGALSYFLGTKCLNLVGKIQFPDGNTNGTAFFEYGFGLRNKGTGQEGWCSVDWDSQEFLYNIDNDEFCETVVALGQMCFINCADNSPACVDKTFTFNAAPEGTPGVVFMGHHSSLSIGFESPSTSLVCQTVEPSKNCPTEFGAVAKNGEKSCLVQADVEARIQSFADGVPAVSAAYWDNGGTLASVGPHDENGGETVEACTAAYDLALSYIEGAYGYPDQVLFDPTLTTEPYRFRPTLAGALSYFLGTKCLNLVGKIQFPDGNTNGTAFFEYGFGLRNKGTGQEGWCSVDWDSQEFLYNIDNDEFCETVVALGQMCFINCADNSPACVDKTFTFNTAPEGTPGVFFMGHHSSLSIGFESPSTSLVCQTAQPSKNCPTEFGAVALENGAKSSSTDRIPVKKSV